MTLKWHIFSRNASQKLLESYCCSLSFIYLGCNKEAKIQIYTFHLWMRWAIFCLSDLVCNKLFSTGYCLLNFVMFPYFWKPCRCQRVLILFEIYSQRLGWNTFIMSESTKIKILKLQQIRNILCARGGSRWKTSKQISRKIDLNTLNV